MGDPRDLRDRRENRIVFAWFLLGAILLMSLYHLGLSITRQSDRPSLYFGVFCLIICARVLTTGERSLVQVFPDFPWEALVKVSYVSFYAAVPVFSLYAKSLFPEELPNKVLWLIGLVGAVFSAVVLFTPAVFYTRTVQIYQVFAVMVYLFGVYVLAAAVYRKRQGALVFFIGYWILILTAINDILYSNLFILSAYVFPFGLFIFMLFQALMLSNRFGKAFNTIEVQQGELLQTNTDYKNELEERARIQAMLSRSQEELEARVKERTLELAAANSDLQREIAERQRAEELLRHSQKLQAIGTLAGGIAHDFNNILQVISINADLARLDVPRSSGPAGNLELIAKAGERGRELVKQVLLFSRKAKREQEVLSLTPLIKETFKLLRASIPTTIEMALILETESDEVDADPSQIQQLIMNLCTNATYAMGGGMGRLEISVRSVAFTSPDSLPDPEMAPGEYLLISVKDTGCGMDEETRKRIFEPFFTTKPAGQGTGLGLSVVYGIVTGHKGSITVSSEPGKGSIFNVYLPKSKSAGPAPAETVEPPPRGKERILFVDDETLIVDSVRSMLERLGYTVTAVTDSMEALRIFSEDPFQFDLVVTDHTMPTMTGEDLGKKIMSIRPDIPVILCSGFNDLISPENARAEGFREFVGKPFSMREGAQMIRRVLDQKPLTRKYSERLK